MGYNFSSWRDENQGERGAWADGLEASQPTKDADVAAGNAWSLGLCIQDRQEDRAVCLKADSSPSASFPGDPGSPRSIIRANVPEQETSTERDSL